MSRAPLPHAVDRFAFFRPLAEYARALGCPVVEVPDGLITAFRLNKALQRNRFDDLVADLDEWLGSDPMIAQAPEWIACAHSGGGLVLYKWLLATDPPTTRRPSIAFQFDAPHRILTRPGHRVSRARLPGILDGSTQDQRGVTTIPVQDYLQPADLVAMPDLPRMVVLSCGEDTFLPEETCFDAAFVDGRAVVQLRLDGAGHSGVCATDEALRSFVREVRALHRSGGSFAQT